MFSKTLILLLISSHLANSSTPEDSSTFKILEEIPQIFKSFHPLNYKIPKPFSDKCEESIKSACKDVANRADCILSLPECSNGSPPSIHGRMIIPTEV
jgi:hypothetical protein